MKSSFKRYIALLLSLIVSIGAFSGCSKSGKGGEKVVYKEITFPLEKEETISMWTPNFASKSVDNYSQMRMYKELMEMSNTKIEFTHPSITDVATQFNIMIASNELPDIFEQGEDYYKGGLSAAYNDGIIIDIMDYIDYAPNFKAIMDAYPELKGEFLDEEGRLLAFPIIRGGNNVRTYVGPVFREDLLNEFSLKAPETIDEWHNTLKVMKDNGIKMPLTITFDDLLNRTVFTGAYGISTDYFVEDGEVVFGFYDERIRDFIKEMNKWYKEGLLDNNIMVNDGKTVSSNFSNKKSGACVTSNGAFETYEREGIDAVAAPYPISSEGQIPYLVYCDKIAYPVASITTQCENKALAVKLLDYFYSYEGNLLANFGIEGETYTIKDGLPVYTDYVMNNPDGKSMSQAGLEYSRAFSFGPFIQDKVYGDQWYGLPKQQEATKIWTKDIETYHKKAPLLRGTLTEAEIEKTVSKQTDIDTYCREQIAKFILGTESLDKLDDYFKQLEKMGIEDLVETHQTVYDRFIKKYPELKRGTNIEVSDIFWKK